MRLSGCVEPQPGQLGATGHPELADAQIRLRLTRGCERVQGARRCRVVDHAEERVRQPHHLAEPVEGDLLQFGRGRGRAPEHRVDVESRGESLAQNPWRRPARSEVGHESGRLPVRGRRDEQGVDIAEDGVHRFPLRGRRLWQRPSEASRLGGAQHRVLLDVTKVIGRPVRHTVGRLAVRVWGHIPAGVVAALDVVCHVVARS